jgi:hypothetical protein
MIPLTVLRLMMRTAGALHHHSAATLLLEEGTHPKEATARMQQLVFGDDLT